jgi:hypothetical protein
MNRKQIVVVFLCLNLLLAYGAWMVIRSSHEPSLIGQVSLDGSIESVMLLYPNRTTRYVLDQPFRILRDGHVEMSRIEDDSTIQGKEHEPVVRLDLNIRGQRVIIFARIKDGPIEGLRP